MNTYSDPSRPKNPYAVALGKRAKGVPKNITEQERDHRRLQAMKLNASHAETRVRQKLRRERIRAEILAAAQNGVFVPIQASE